MNLRASSRAPRGIFLMECMVYIALIALLAGAGYVLAVGSLDFHRGLVASAGDMVRSLEAGEAWRRDVRAATGPVIQEGGENGRLLEIPSGQGRILYRLEGGTLFREVPGRLPPQPFLARVSACEFLPEDRGPVRAWRWELELESDGDNGILPLYTFLAVEP